MAWVVRRALMREVRGGVEPAGRVRGQSQAERVIGTNPIADVVAEAKAGEGCAHARTEKAHLSAVGNVTRCKNCGEVVSRG